MEKGPQRSAEQAGFDLARHYAAHAKDLREALGLSPDAPLTAHPLAQGEHNSNFVLESPGNGARYVLRIVYDSQMGLEHQARYEYEALEVLQASGVTPRPLFVDESCSVIGKQLLVIDYCEGSWLDYANAHDLKRSARLLADVHAVPTNAETPLVRPDDPLRAQYETCCGFLENYRRSGIADAGALKAVDGFARAAKRALDVPVHAADVSHILNTEAVASHFLMPEDPQTRGTFLDWEKPVIGEVAQDVAYFLSPTTTIWDTDYIFTPAERERFVKTYWEKVDGRFSAGSFAERFDSYVKMNCLLGITWSANALVYYHDESRELLNEKTRAKLGTYLSSEFLETCHDIAFAS